jgi:hypothetical protein
MQPGEFRRGRGRGSAERLVDDHASRLVRAPASGLSDAIVAALEAAGRRLGADGVTLRDLPGGARRLVLAPPWSRPGRATPVTRLGADDLPRLGERVRDGGPGMAAQASAHVFDPFFTTKPGGLGLPAAPRPGAGASRRPA